MRENPGAYDEARKRINRTKEQQKNILLLLEEDFKKSKEKLRKHRKRDVFQLKNKVATSNSLDSLKADIGQALKEWIISRDTYNQVIASIEETSYQAINNIDENKENPLHKTKIGIKKIPFSHNAIAQYFEKQPLWSNIWADIAWFMYGFFVQGSAILIIIAWNILLDLIKLPVDIYRQIKS